MKVVYTRVDQIQLAVVFNGRAREASAPVVFLGREKRYGQVLPGYEIRAYRMPPVHPSPFIAVGEALVEEMVLPAVEDKAVGVVDPAAGRLKMQSVHPDLLPLCRAGC